MKENLTITMNWPIQLWSVRSITEVHDKRNYRKCSMPDVGGYPQKYQLKYNFLKMKGPFWNPKL